MVRIQFPPAGSHVATVLGRNFLTEATFTMIGSSRVRRNGAASENARREMRSMSPRLPPSYLPGHYPPNEREGVGPAAQAAAGSSASSPLAWHALPRALSDNTPVGLYHTAPGSPRPA